MTRSIWVYASWGALKEPTHIGNLEVDFVRGAEVYRFAYASTWLDSPYATQIDPRLTLFSGDQYNDDARNFRVFLDSCPDRWGRLLMQRREMISARQEGRRVTKLNESDYLLGVHDTYRMGGLRFKLMENGPFLDNNQTLTAPPVSSLSELEYAVGQIEKQPDLDDPNTLKWLSMLISPGSSLGGARPKACVTDGNDLWLAKFPSCYDDHDIGAWEYLVYCMAIDAGIEMAPCQIKRFHSEYHTFLTKRFDRNKNQRIHFASAMTQLGYYDGDAGASYLEISQFLIQQGSKTQEDLSQLWRRIVFNIMVRNSDDHLRNHGFLLANNNSGWRLSPAYDINIALGATGLHLNIDEHSNALDLELAIEVSPYFQLTLNQAKQIISEVKSVRDRWHTYADRLRITRQEQKLMEMALS